MALRLYGKPQTPIMPDDMVLASWATRAFGGGRSFQHAKSFDVVLLPNSDRKVTVGALPSGTPYTTPSALNRVGEDGLLVVMDASEEIQFDMATTSPRWDILAIKITGAGANTGTASLVVLKGVEGNTQGSQTVTLAGSAVNWTNTPTDRIWPLRNVQVTPGQAAVTLGKSYLVFHGRVGQVLDATPPDTTALPAGSAFLDTTGAFSIRVTDANGTLTDKALSATKVNTYSIAAAPSMAAYGAGFNGLLSVSNANLDYPVFVDWDAKQRTRDLNYRVRADKFFLANCPATGATYAYLSNRNPGGGPMGDQQGIYCLAPSGGHYELVCTLPGLGGADNSTICISENGKTAYISSTAFTGSLRAVDLATKLITTISLPPAMGATDNHGLVCTKGHLYVLGGRLSGSPQTPCAKMNIATGAWTVLSPAPAALMSQGWITGDRIGCRGYSSMLNTSNDTWSTLSVSGSTTAAPMGTLPNGKLWAVTTGSSGNYQNVLHQIEPTNGSATRIGSEAPYAAYGSYVMPNGVDGLGRLTWIGQNSNQDGTIYYAFQAIAPLPSVSITATGAGEIATLARSHAVMNPLLDSQPSRSAKVNPGDPVVLYGGYRMRGGTDSVTALITGSV